LAMRISPGDRRGGSTKNGPPPRSRSGGPGRTYVTGLRSKSRYSAASSGWRT
jgi:hypothetical protein